MKLRKVLIFKIIFIFISSQLVFNESIFIVRENMLYMILISSAALTLGTLKDNGEITKIKNILNIKNLLNFI